MAQEVIPTKENMFMSILIVDKNEFCKVLVEQTHLIKICTEAKFFDSKNEELIKQFSRTNYSFGTFHGTWLLFGWLSPEARVTENFNEAIFCHEAGDCFFTGKCLDIYRHEMWNVLVTCEKDITKWSLLNVNLKSSSNKLHKNIMLIKDPASRIRVWQDPSAEPHYFSISPHIMSSYDWFNDYINSQKTFQDWIGTPDKKDPQKRIEKHVLICFLKELHHEEWNESDEYLNIHKKSQSIFKTGNPFLEQLVFVISKTLKSTLNVAFFSAPKPFRFLKHTKHDGKDKYEMPNVQYVYDSTKEFFCGEMIRFLSEVHFMTSSKPNQKVALIEYLLRSTNMERLTKILGMSQYKNTLEQMKKLNMFADNETLQAWKLEAKIF